MSFYEEIDLGSCPSDVDPIASVGDPDYAEKGLLECQMYKAQLLRLLGDTRVESLKLVVKRNGHDFGTYYSVVAKFKNGDEAAMDQAFWLENNSPTQWDVESYNELMSTIHSKGLSNEL